MNGENSANRRTGLKANLIGQLHNPARLRIFVIAAVLASGYFGIYDPLQSNITTTTKKIGRDNKSLNLATSLERLQAEYRKFEDRIPKDTDSKEWVQYVLDGLRLFPLKLAKLDCRDPKRVGSYTAINLRIELEGKFADMDKFLRWIETNPRLLRVDEITITPSRGESGVNTMRLVILGLSS